MNYQRIHDEIISRARNRVIDDSVYYENHHIIPTSMGGNDDPDNKVKLTGKEHYLVHWLLYKINPHPKLAYAWHRMSYNPIT